MVEAEARAGVVGVGCAITVGVLSLVLLLV